jgi:transposase
MQQCPRCQSDWVINNGSAAGKPKKRCKQCGYQFTRTTPRGKPLQTKILAVLLYLSGLSMNRIATLCGVSAQAVLNWIRAFAKEHYEKPAPEGKAVVLEVDEMWHYVKKNYSSKLSLSVRREMCYDGHTKTWRYVRWHAEPHVHTRPPHTLSNRCSGTVPSAATPCGRPITTIGRSQP